MKVLKIVFVAMVATIFLAGQAYSAPKGNNGKAKEHVNKGKSEAAKANKGNKGQAAAVQKQQARRANEAKQRREAKNRFAQHNPDNDNGNNNLALNARRGNNARRDGLEKNNEKAPRALGLVDALNRARWAHNPHDARGQGNMGKVDMQDPFGHDKDSDRKELYGNNGRPIHKKDKDEEPQEEAGEPAEEALPQAEEPIIEAPEIVEELPVEEEPVTELPVEEEGLLLDAAIDFSSLDSMQWLVDWYERVIVNYDPNDPNYAFYQQLWYDHFFPGGDMNTATGIRLNNAWDETDRYDYDIALNGFEGDSLIVTTTMTLVEGYSGTAYYNLDGSYSGESIDHEAGEVVYEQTEELGVDSTLDAVTVGITASSDLVDIAWGSEEVYVDLAVTVTDPTTGATTTQTYDKSLYLYRCPYGKVTDGRTGQAIVNAKITVHFEDDSIVALDKATNKTANNPQMTDATGRFGFILQTNRKYYMTAKAEGYEEYRSPVFTEQWHVLREDIKMEPKLEQVASK